MEIRISSTLSLLPGLSLLLLLLLAGAVKAEHTCYDTWGNSDENLSPCYSPGTTDLNANTHCCRKGDICLSNGLCISPGSQYIMTQQGCTDKAWGKSCSQYCSKNNQQNSDAAIPLIACPNSVSGGSAKFCCGSDASSCCQTSSSWISVPTGTMYQADIVRATFTTTPESSSSSSSADDSSLPLKLGLGIGIGIGVPILLVLSAVVYFLARPRYHPGSRPRDGRKQTARGGGGGSSSSNNHFRNYSTNPSSRRDKERRDSFGRVDTNVGPPSDDGDWDPRGGASAMWPPNGANNAAAAIAAWALHHSNPPPSPKEMDAGRISRTRMTRRGETPTRFPAELPGHHHDVEGTMGPTMGGRRGFDGGDDGDDDDDGDKEKVMMELPTPDYERHPIGGYPQHSEALDEPDPETHTRSTTVQVDADGRTLGDQVSPLTIASPAVLGSGMLPPPPQPVLAEGVRGERYVKMIDIKMGKRRGQQQYQQSHQGSRI
ncbi:hypothetical protein QBC42DRAFT_319265 [Cladorrhinum samala]|uniref:Uncharacterized protein n=1 Tax=Cladorrhinum samala TaxID=585594 RepID=A0AAV9I539_9PEZI|nr:hypothetical protein QBC42DRAFT_319265 [Cladorrhinum samala]